MFNLVYHSFAAPTLDCKQIEEIVTYSRGYNEKNDITGFLIYHKGIFLQYLEGEEDIILQLYNRIKKDTRHTKVTLLSKSYTYSREFDNWSMGYKNSFEINQECKNEELLVSHFMETKNMAAIPNPTSKMFWVAVKKLLK